MEKKNLIPFVILAAIVLLGGAAFILSPKSETAGEAPLGIAPVPSVATSSGAIGGTPAVPAVPGTAGAGSNATVGGKTVWRDIRADEWGIVFKVQTKWKAAPTYGADHMLSQVSVAGDTESFFVSKNIKIAEPSKLSYTTKTMAIAGKSVSVHVYAKPNATNAFYWYFSFPEATDTYYFRIESSVPSTTIPDDFIGFVTIK